MRYMYMYNVDKKFKRCVDSTQSFFISYSKMCMWINWFEVSRDSLLTLQQKLNKMHVKECYRSLHLTEGHMHCDVIVLDRNDVQS